MDHKLGGVLLQHYAVLLLFMEVHLTLVSCAPAPASCGELDRAKSLTKLVEFEARQLLELYVNRHFRGTPWGPVPADVPDATVSGDGTREKLRNIYDKNVLYYLHVATVQEYEDTLWGGHLTPLLSNLKTRLSHHLEKIKSLITDMDPGLPLPAPPPPPPLSHGDDFQKKMYGWGVLTRLTEWTLSVVSLFEDMEDTCQTPYGA